MAHVHEPDVRTELADYEAVAHLSAAAAALRAEGTSAAPALRGRTVWMLNSTSSGGGVAELLPAQISLLRDLGIDVRWIVIETDRPDFFAFTKRLHNLVHGVTAAHPTAAERALYEEVSRQNADSLRGVIGPNDILVVHDPQPLGTGALLRERLGLKTIWRCHIGLDRETPDTRAAWEFLQPYVTSFDHAVFSLPQYVPDFMRERATIIHPSIDPLGPKNRELSLHKLVGVLADAGLAATHWPLLEPPFQPAARRLQPDGSLAPATLPDDIGLLARPIVTQVSRWDRLKGYGPLLDAFVQLKRAGPHRPFESDLLARRMETVRLVLAGPDPDGIQDDPEAVLLFQQLSERYLALDRALQDEIAIVTLPLASRKQNALMVNALQRASDVVAQNSLHEGFGLTVAEAMWKRIPVLGSARACGIALQVRDGVEGRLVDDPEDSAALAEVLFDMLSDADRLERWGRDAQRRVHDHFLIFTELHQWLQLLAAQR